MNIHNVVTNLFNSVPSSHEAEAIVLSSLGALGAPSACGGGFLVRDLGKSMSS